jgi:hypothetical protein
MTAAASSVPPGDDRARTWAEATPAEVRSALTPESADEFDQQWRAALARAAETYDLGVVHGCLEAWRRVARITAAAGGADGYRALQDAASAARETREPEAARVSWREVRAGLGL